MIGVLTLFAAAAVQPEDKVIPAFFTGERFLEICSESDAGQCWMYVAGVLDGIFHAESSHETQSICGGKRLRKAAEIVVQFLRERPELQRKAAAVIVEMALRSRLPCSDDDADQT
jgi:hypothetical protein